jgi:hypothetical protein
MGLEFDRQHRRRPQIELLQMELARLRKKKSGFGKFIKGFYSHGKT